VPEEGPRFENLVGFHLLKESHFQEDAGGRDAELRFFRDVEGREVDFVQMVGGEPVRFVECKLADTTISPSLLFLRRKFPAVDAIQVLATRGVDRTGDLGVRLVSADRFLTELAL